MKPKMKLKSASTPPEVVKVVMNEVNARQGRATFITTLVSTFPVPSGKIFHFVKKKPKRMMMIVLAIAVQRLVDDIAFAMFSETEASRMVTIRIHSSF